jgi:hypothetical protein
MSPGQLHLFHVNEEYALCFLYTESKQTSSKQQGFDFQYGLLIAIYFSRCWISCFVRPLSYTGWMIGGFKSCQGLLIFLFTTVPRQVLGPAQPPIQWELGTLSLGIKRRSLKLTTHLHLIPRSRMRGAILPLPNTPSWRGAHLNHRDNFTFTFTFTFNSNVCSSHHNSSIHFLSRKVKTVTISGTKVLLRYVTIDIVYELDIT